MLRSIDVLGKNAVLVTETENFTSIEPTLCLEATTIDDVLLLCSNVDAILIYPEHVCKVFLKYRVSFRIEKCDFLKN